MQKEKGIKRLDAFIGRSGSLYTARDEPQRKRRRPAAQMQRPIKHYRRFNHALGQWVMF
jgi:hypothetical protein